jgi:hypothetical protein
MPMRSRGAPTAKCHVNIVEPHVELEDAIRRPHQCKRSLKGVAEACGYEGAVLSHESLSKADQHFRTTR